jgi:LysR family hydrogen peroxide-inducible transcriptional activator
MTSLAPHPFTLRQLQYVVAVADRRSFRQAAQDCRVAQPSLSAQIAQVEDILGVRLFERDRRRVLPTPSGQALVERARALLRDADGMLDAARSLSDPLAGPLRVGVIPTIGPYLLPEVAPALHARFPRLLFLWTEDRTAALMALLASGAIDAALVALEAEVGDLPRVVLGKDPFVLAAPPGHALSSSRKGLDPSDLDGERVLFLDDGHCFRDQALAFCSRAGAEEAGFRATSLSTLVQMAAGGAGITLLPSLALAVENRRHALRTRHFATRAPSRTLALVWRRAAALEPALRAVGDALRELYGKLERQART